LSPLVVQNVLSVEIVPALWPFVFSGAYPSNTIRGSLVGTVDKLRTVRPKGSDLIPGRCKTSGPAVGPVEPAA
jgi:hypothetical protein